MVLGLVALAAVSLLIDGQRTGVAPMPSSRRMRAAIVAEIGDYAAGRVIYDLGSGWGGLARHIAHAHPERSVVAIERSLIPLIFSRITSALWIVPNLRHHHTDFHSMPLTDESIHVTYISGLAMSRLRQQFERDVPQGGVLISCAFAMPGWTPVRTIVASGVMHTPIYVYEY